MEDFVRKTKGVRDINSLPLSANHELDMVADVKGKIYIKILNRYKELLFDNGTEPWVVEMLNNLEVDVEQLKEDILDVEQALSELPLIEDKLKTVETTLNQLNTLFTQMKTDVDGLDLRTSELEREVIQLALKDQELLNKINNLDVDILYSNSIDFKNYDSIDDPNLLKEPYYLSKNYFGENIADPTKTFPIKISSYNIYQGKNTENYQLNQTYTLTMKATKPDTQQFKVYLLKGAMGVGTMQLVEGSSDIWKLTFKVTQAIMDTGVTDVLDLYQAPNTSVGDVIIDWIKLEKGNTQTPNIPYYKYVGININDSTNPNDYQWIPLAKAAETVNDKLTTVDNKLTTTIATSDTVNALQNSRLTTLESKVVDTAWQNLTPISPFTAPNGIQVKRQNGIVYLRGSLSGDIGDCFTLPEGFRPPSGYEYHYLLPGQSTVQTDAAKIYVKHTGVCSIVSKSGTTPVLLEPIIFSIT